MKNVSEKKVRALKAEAARRGLTLSQAIEEAIELWLRARGGVVTDELGDDLVWERVKHELLKKAKGMYAVIAEGRFIGVYATNEEVSRVLKELKARGCA